MMKLINDYKDALKNIYEHVGFVQDWVVFPIDDCTDKYWSVNDENCIYADSKEQFESEGDYYQDEICKQRFYDKWVYEGEQITMVICNPLVDGVRWFRVFDNSKRM